MTPAARTGALFMVAALAFYTAGVWSERLSARLKPWHLAMFWLGLACDSLGTDRMRQLAGSLRLSFHSVTGVTALALMLGHAAWATAVVVRGDERALRTFHRVSVVVWTVWLVPFVSGAILV